MNYTKNYHLPQWEETDRIMMADFNRMCADIDGGLTGDRETAARARDALAEDAESRAFDRACRAAYNHYCFAQTVTPFPRQLGVFHLDTSLSGSGLAGMSKFEGHYQMNNASRFTADTLFALFSQTEMVSLRSGQRDPLILTFTAPGNGAITQLTLQIDLTANQHLDSPFDLTYQDLTTGETMVQTALPIYLEFGTATMTYTITERLVFQDGHKYRLTILRQNPNYDTRASIIQKNMRIECNTTGGAASASWTYRGTEENLGMVAVISYSAVGSCEDPKLFFRGEEIAPWWVRNVDNGKGKTIREAVFRRNGPVEDNSTFLAQFACGEDGTLTLYSWGVTLL